MARKDLIQYRRGTAATWASVNPTLAAGEVGFSTDANEIRVGDGVTPWVGLDPLSDPSGAEALDIIEDGRLSEDGLSVTIGQVTAVDIANPETATHDAVAEVVETQVVAGAPGLLKLIDARGNLSISRGSWAGVVAWQIYVGDQNPAHWQSGDFIWETSSTPEPWQPSDIPGIVGWFDASMLPAVDGASITTWDNLIGAGPDATLIAGGTAPVYAIAGLSGKPTVTFSGLGALLGSGLADLSRPWSIYLYGRYANASVSQRMLSSVNAQGTSAFTVRRSATVHQALFSSTTLSGDAADTSAHLIRVKIGSNDMSMRIDNAAPVTVSAVPSITASGIVLGGTSTGTSLFNGSISQALIVNATVSPADEALLLARINTLYGTSFTV